MAVFPAGHILTSADFDTLFPTGVGAWTTFTPTWTQSATVTKTVGQARYMKIGRLTIAHVVMTATGAGTAANAVQGGLPVAAQSAAGFGVVGAGYFYDASANTVYALSALLSSSTTVGFRTGTSTADLGATGGVFTAAIAAADILTYTVQYEATS